MSTPVPFPTTGEVGRVMAGWDWSGTPVGDPSTWPEALRGMVRVLLSSRFSMWMAWGPDLAFFYNDAYRRDTLQAKHPWALGRPAREVWAEIWDAIGPRIGSVLETGAATWDEDLLLFLERSGYPEETYHTFSYSTLADAYGSTEGMLCVVAETTERVLGERRMATLRDLAAAVARTRTEDGVLTAVRDHLAANPRDLPFAATYVFDAYGTAALACSSGLPEDAPVAPRSIGDDSLWQVPELRAGRTVLLDDLPPEGLPTGAWQVPPTQAVAVPFAGTQGAEMTGFLVVGLNPHRRWDDAYRGFVDLLANQVSSGLINAGSYEAERRRAESLAQLDRAKTDFFSNVSHEFRTPLTLIAGPVSELRSAPAVQADARLREELETVHRNAQRLGKLVNTLLDYSRLQAGRIAARFEPVELAAFTAELASVFRSAVERAGLTYRVDCSPPGDAVHVDREMWEKIVLNLLSNALKHTFTGGITVRLTRADDDAVELTVEDTGTGIPAEELPRLFERFHRVEGARSRSGEGSGIGLAMVHELVGLHGGSITAESTPGEGTTVRVQVPLGADHLPEEHVVAAGGDATVSPAAEPFVSEALRWLPQEGLPVDDAGTATGAPAAAPDPLAPSAGRVLVADDNTDMREYVRRLLAPRYSVQLVGDGLSALAAAVADPPDLVVSDVMMPGMDGMALLGALRADARTARVPVVLLSARAGQEAAVEGLSAGADDYLVKPFSAQELLARVGAHLQLGRVRREAEERFTTMADLAPALIWVAGPGGGRTFVNRGWQHYTGRDVADDLGTGWTDGIHPDDRARYDEVVGRALEQRSPWEVEFRLRRADGAYHWLLERAVPIGTREDVVGFVGSCTDINARHQETERQALLASLGSALDREAGVDDQLARLARLAVDSRLAEMCVVRRVDDDGTLRIAGVAALDGPTETALAALDPDSDMGRAAVAGRSMLHREVPAGWPRSDGRMPEDQVALHRQLDIRTAITAPLAVRGRVLAALSMGRGRDAPRYNEDDLRLAEELAERAALALDNSLLLAEERASAARLALLQEATAELSAATTPAQVASVTATYVRRLIGPTAELGVFEMDRQQRALSALSLSGLQTSEEGDWAVVPMTMPAPVTIAALERRPLWISDLTDEDDEHVRRFPELARAMAALQVRATAALPLLAVGRVVGVLGLGFLSPRRLSATEREMLVALAEQCAQALDRARLYRSERRIAETLQRSLLPQDLPRLRRLALAARYLPGAEGTHAGGDWYDVVELDEHRVAIAVGDVVGQGPAAAAVMGQLRSALSTALLDGHSPAAALELLDRFAARVPGAVASTAACLVLDRERGEIRWARAGHLPPVLLEPTGPVLLETAGSGVVLGVPGRPPYREGRRAVEPGTGVLLFTDGIVERRGEDLDQGLERLATASARLSALTPEDLLTRLLDELLGEAGQPDDVALVLARYLPAPLREERPARPAELAGVRRSARRWAAAMGLSEETSDDLLLALNEAFANCVEHAYAGRSGGTVEYTVEAAPDDAIEVCVHDAGTWRPAPADPGSRGRGLELIRRLTDDVAVDSSPAGGTTVRFRLLPSG